VAAARRAIAETSAAEVLRAHVAAQAAFAESKAAATQAGHLAVEAHDQRAALERQLAALRRPARRRLAVALSVAGVLAVAALLLPRFSKPPVVPDEVGEPLKLKLEYRLTR
jgi:ferric-dicitrate binding protein FerR (iron transport regulator)